MGKWARPERPDNQIHLLTVDQYHPQDGKKLHTKKRKNVIKQFVRNQAY